MSKFFKIATWNINSIRVRTKQLVDWLTHHDIDILLLQETKCQDEHFPFTELEHLGYNIYISGQKSYNGVAIFSKIPADEVITTFANNPCPHEARYIEIALNLPIGYSRIASVYVPNGGEVESDKYSLKLSFLKSLTNYLEDQKVVDENFIIGGDYNVALEDLDVSSPKEWENVAGFTLEERKLLRELIYRTCYEDPYRLVYPSKQEFSWWDYRAGAFQHDIGMRIDYFLSSSSSLKFLHDVIIDKLERAKQKSSDHAPVITIYKL